VTPVAGFPARPPVRPANPKPATEENRMTPPYAVIHVPTPDGFAWPIVERVVGGWQSGEHHYPDAGVLDVRPLTLVDLAGSDAATADAPPEASDWRTRGCTIAGRSVDESCGEPVHGAVLVHTYALPLSDGIRAAPLPRGVLVCRRHFGGLTGAPPFPPDLDAGRGGGCACAPSGGDGVQCPDANGQLACDVDPAPVSPVPPTADVEAGGR
jgi:hypothetical protein